MRLPLAREVEVDVLEEAVERLIAALHASRAREGHLQRALQTRVVIEQAKGVLGERLRVPPEETFELLRRRARAARRNIHDVARELVATTAVPPRV